MTTPAQTLEFQTEARQLLQLVIHSIYSNRDVFLRELISNASDALDKLRLESYRNKDLELDINDLHIELEADPEARTLTVRDNGIGMSREDVVSLLGTIAKSGTAEFLRELSKTQDSAASRDLIGQFGVGFYASFMVADNVEVISRRAGASEGVRWSSDGSSTYTVESVADAPQGTSVILHLKPVDLEDHLYDYTDRGKLREIVKHYSDFITWPIRMSGQEPDSEPVTLNSMKALWARSQSDVSQDEYNEFYKHISHDWTDPAETIRLQAEGTFEYQALLFIPAQAPLDLFMAERKRGVQLYVRRVFIMDDCAELIPEYLRFVKGVVDAQDLSLNVSREILQRDRQIQLIRRRLVKRVLGAVKSMMTEDPEKYAAFWTAFGPVVKEGLLGDTDNRDAILEICSFESTNDGDSKATLRQYIERMKDGQEHIYYLTGDSRAAIEKSPHMEAFAAKGFEVLILTDPIDEMWVTAIGDVEGKQLQSIAKGQVDLDTEEEKKAAAALREEFDPLLSWLGSTLEEQVKQVRLSTRLTSSPACIVSDTHDLSPALEKMYRTMGQQLPAIKRILELNPTHPLIRGLREAHTQRPDDAELAESAELVYSLALLADGGELPDPSRFITLLAPRLAKSF